MCVFVCAHLHVWVHMWGPKINIGCLSHHYSILFMIMMIIYLFIYLRQHLSQLTCYSLIRWNYLSPRNLLIHFHLVLGLQVHTTLLVFHYTWVLMG